MTYYGPTADALLSDMRDAIIGNLTNLTKSDKWETVHDRLTDLLDETKWCEGDRFEYRDCGVTVEVTVDRNLLRFAGYLLDLMEV